MHIGWSRAWALVIGFILAAVPGAGARAGFFANAFAGSPLGSFGPAPGYGGIGETLTSSTSYTDGVNTFFSEGDSSVSLATGQLHASAAANFGYVPDAIATQLAGGSSDQFGNSSFGDDLTFLGTFTNQTVTFHVSVDGTFTGNITGFNGSDFQFMILPTGTIDANSDNTILGIFDNSSITPIFNQKDTLPTTPTISLQYDVPVTLNGVNPTIEFAANLNVNPFALLGDNFTADFSNTATISFDPLPGVTVISASGVFPGTVPEPGSLALGLVGLAATGLFTHARRRRSRAAA